MKYKIHLGIIEKNKIYKRREVCFEKDLDIAKWLNVLFQVQVSLFLMYSILYTLFLELILTTYFNTLENKSLSLYYLLMIEMLTYV